MEITLLAIMEKTKDIRGDKNKGVSEEYISELETKAGQPFPLAYKEFLYLGGEDANFIADWDHGIYKFDEMPYVEQQQLLAKEELEMRGYKIEKPFWVFADAEACQKFHFFYFDEGDDPAIYHYCSYMPQDDSSVAPQARKYKDKFSEYVEWMIAYRLKVGY